VACLLFAAASTELAVGRDVSVSSKLSAGWQSSTHPAGEDIVARISCLGDGLSVHPFEPGTLCCVHFDHYYLCRDKTFAERHAVMMCVCPWIRLYHVLTARRIICGGEGNALLSSSLCCLNCIFQLRFLHGSVF